MRRVSSGLARPEPGQIEKWRRRHAYPDAIGVWATASGIEARAFAFNAIAQDPRVLYRAAHPQAVRMAAQAEDFLTSLDQGAGSNDAWHAVGWFVRQAIDEWRSARRAYNSNDDGNAVIAPAIAHTISHDPWQIARRNFPHVEDATGLLAIHILREFGEAALTRARKPWDHVIALAILRYAARQLRGEVLLGDRGAVIADVRVVQSCAERTGLRPMLTGYTGPGKPAQQALGLARDACTLRDAVGGACWQAAIDFHAFALVALDHRLLLDLQLDEAQDLAVAAIRLADEATDVTIMPNLPPTSGSSPKVVRLHALACLGGRPDLYPPTNSSAR